MTGVKPYTDDFRQLVPFLIKELEKEICEAYPSVKATGNLMDCLLTAVKNNGDKFIIIIDVGISYDKNAKPGNRKLRCRIVRVEE